MDDKTIAWIALIGVGVAGGMLGYWLFKNTSKGETQKNAAVPIVGPMLNFEEWMPRNARMKNIMLNKLYCIIMTCLGFYNSFFFVFALMGLLFHIDWIKEDGTKM
jgi:hypothetical protein